MRDRVIAPERRRADEPCSGTWDAVRSQELTAQPRELGCLCTGRDGLSIAGACTNHDELKGELWEVGQQRGSYAREHGKQHAAGAVGLVQEMEERSREWTRGGGDEARTSETENSGEMTQRVCRQRRAGGRDATAAGRE